MGFYFTIRTVVTRLGTVANHTLSQSYDTSYNDIGASASFWNPSERLVDW